MPDKKISQLSASTTPLAGTEELPIVQSSQTVKVSVSNLTAGRDVLASRIGLGISPTIPFEISKAGDQVLIRATNTTASQTARILAVCGTASCGIVQYGQTHATRPNTLNIGGPGNFLISANGVSDLVELTSDNNTFSGNSYTFTGRGTTNTIRILPNNATPTFGTTTNCNLGLIANSISIAVLTTTGNVSLTQAGASIVFAGNNNALWRTGTGSPEGAVTAPVGSLYTDTSGGAGTTLYVKESGAGNTGWVAK